MNVRAETVALCVAVSSLFACGRSGLDLGGGASGAGGSTGAADTTGTAGISGVAGTAGRVGNAGSDGGAGTPVCERLGEAACKAAPNCHPYTCPCSNQDTFIACMGPDPGRPVPTCPIGVCPAAGAIDGGDSASGDGAMDGTSKPFPSAAGAGCSKDGWCWSTPLPQGNLLKSVSGSGASDVWAVGGAGAIIHWDGRSWAEVQSGTQAPLSGVWSASASEAWAVGYDAAVVHWDGSTWSPATSVPTPPAGCVSDATTWMAVWGSGPSDVWIVGLCQAPKLFGAAIHWDGSQWTPFTLPEGFGAIWGTGPNDAWAIGSDTGDLFQWDGQSWTAVLTGQSSQHGGTAIWGSSSSDLWLGCDGDINADLPPTHWNGMVVGSDAGTSGVIDSSGYASALWGSSSDDVWAVGARRPTDPYWVADEGLILHWNGVTWSQLPSTGAGPLSGVWGSHSDDVWAVGYFGEIVHWDGRTWSAPAEPAPLLLYVIWGGGPDDVWAFGDDEMGLGALHWNGQTWARTEILDAAALGASATQWATCPGGQCNGIGIHPCATWGSGSDDIWVGGCGTASFLVHWDGHSWSRDSSLDAGIAASMQVASMWGNGPQDVWAVGQVASDMSGVAIHWDGTRWSAVTSLSSSDLAHSFRSVWSSGPDDVWIGAETAVLHWDGHSWSQPQPGAFSDPSPYYTIGGSGPSDVWAVTPVGGGLPSNASHWNGTSWQQFTVSGIISSASIVAPSPTNAWLLDGLHMAHWDGAAWTLSASGSNQFPGDSIHGGPNLYWDGTQVWTIGVEGVIRHP
jgi:hypothetical protein